MKRILFGLLTIIMFLVPLVSNATIGLKDKDLLLYLPCNEGKGNVVGDLSQNKFDGQVIGKVEWDNGKYGKALLFTEAGEVKCPHIELNNKSFTVCLWTKPKLSGGAEQCVFTQTQVNAQNTSLHFRIYTSGTVRMGFYSNDLDAAGAVKADEWVHICYWLDLQAKLRRLYINGQKVAEDAGKAGLPYLGNSGDTMIGSWGGTGQKFNGLIDEVQVWNRALSEKDIQDSMLELTKAFAVDSSGKLTITWGEAKISY